MTSCVDSSDLSRAHALRVARCYALRSACAKLTPVRRRRSNATGITLSAVNLSMIVPCRETSSCEFHFVPRAKNNIYTIAIQRKIYTERLFATAVEICMSTLARAYRFLLRQFDATFFFPSAIEEVAILYYRSIGALPPLWTWKQRGNNPNLCKKCTKKYCDISEVFKRNF